MRGLRRIACACIILVVMGLVGCEASGLGMSSAESVIAAAVVGSPSMVLMVRAVQRWLVPNVHEKSTDAEVMTVIELFRDEEMDNDLQRWFTDGGRVGPWD